MNKINPKTFINAGDTVKLNKIGLQYFDTELGKYPFTVLSVYNDLDEYALCAIESGADYVRNCTCHVRYSLISDGIRLTNVMFDEMDIVDLK